MNKKKKKKQEYQSIGSYNGQNAKTNVIEIRM